MVPTRYPSGNGLTEIRTGSTRCYAFDSNGYIYTNTTTPDGYTVNADGAWMIGNSVQLKYQKDMDSQNNSGNASDNNQSTSSDDSTVYTNEDMVRNLHDK